MYLTAAGVGTIGLVDFDTVDLSNLQCQIIHQTQDIGKEKIISGRETINALNPDVEVKVYNELVNSANVCDIIKDADYDLYPTKIFPVIVVYFRKCRPKMQYRLADKPELSALFKIQRR